MFLIRPVINFFSLPTDDECLSDDGRRIGMCMNVYECRIQGIMTHKAFHLISTFDIRRFSLSRRSQAEHRAAIVPSALALAVSVS